MGHISEYLTFWEGYKRIESFISEHYIAKQLKQWVPDSYSLAFNWYRLTFGRFTKKNLFIKLCLNRNFTGADRKFIEYCLNDKECECIVVHFDGTCFTAYRPDISANRRISLSKYSDGNAIKCIKDITGASHELHPAQPASNKGSGPDIVSVVNDLLSNLSQEEQDELYANRKFIYEVVIPAHKYNPSDIDAIFLNQFNKIEIFEFKRKKPAHNSFRGPAPTYESKLKILENLESKSNNSAYLSKIKFTEMNRALESLGYEKLPNSGYNNFYGIDTGHYKFIDWCTTRNIPYHLLHLDRGKTGSNKIINCKNWTLFQEEVFTYKTISTHDFVGFAYTLPSQSGMNKDLRFQHTCLRKEFIEIPCRVDIKPVISQIMPHHDTTTAAPLIYK